VKRIMSVGGEIMNLCGRFWTSGKLYLGIAAVGSVLFVPNASATVMGTLLSGSTGTVTATLSNVVFNNDPSAQPLGVCTTSLGKGCNSDVATSTSLSFVGGPLVTAEGIYVNNNDLTLTAPSAADANTFLTFAAHPNLVFSISWPPGPGSANTDCSTANANGLSCSVFAGSPGVLTYQNGHTVVSLGVAGKASDTGVGGLAAGSNYTGGFSQTYTDLLPNGTAPTPRNIQLYFCPTGVCQPSDFTSGRSLTSSQSGSFTASAVPEPQTTALVLGGLLVLLGRFGMRRYNRGR
jgi:hypothetical protein